MANQADALIVHVPVANMTSEVVDNEIRLVLIGKTGTGKSATGNTILGSKEAFKSALGASSITKQCLYAHGFNCGKRISIVDTPGLYDTGIDNKEVSQEIEQCVGISSPGPHAIIFVTRIGRFTNEEKSTIQHFVDHFGIGMYKYMIVIFTGGDDLEYEEKTLEHFVAEAPPLLKEILHLAGNRYLAFNNRSKDREQVQSLLSLVSSTVAANGGTYYTNEMYLEAEAALKAKEEQERLEAEAKKQEEINRIKAECKADMDKELQRIEREHRAAMDRMRDEHRNMMAAMTRRKRRKWWQLF